MNLFQFKQNSWAIVFVIYLRYLIGGAFVFSSYPKIVGERFTSANGEFEPIDSWIHFFETLYRSGLYWNFLGWTQLLAGFLLMTQLFASMGNLIFFPMILNIFIITVSYSFTGTPIVTGLMLLCSLCLLIWDTNKFLPLLNVNVNYIYSRTIETEPIWFYAGLLLFATTVVLRAIGYNILLWFSLCFAEGIGGLILYYLAKKKNWFIPKEI